MEENPRISHSEWLVMKVIWSSPPIAYQEVSERLAGSTGWKPKTVQTLLRRLVAKRVLDYQARGRSHYYFAKVDEEDCIEAEGKSFLQRCFGGGVKPMLAHFVRKEDLSPEEIDDLMRMLSEKRKRARRVSPATSNRFSAG